MTTTTEQPAPDLYPQRNETAYGRGVWELGIDGDWGVIVEGHDHRAWAALSRWARVERDLTAWIALRAVLDLGPQFACPRRRWMTWREDCGCNPEEHTAHLASDDGCDPCETGDPLPPCNENDEVAWMPRWHDEPVAGAVPMIVWEYVR